MIIFICEENAKLARPVALVNRIKELKPDCHPFWIRPAGGEMWYVNSQTNEGEAIEDSELRRELGEAQTGVLMHLNDAYYFMEHAAAAFAAMGRRIAFYGGDEVRMPEDMAAKLRDRYPAFADLSVQVCRGAVTAKLLPENLGEIVSYLTGQSSALPANFATIPPRGEIGAGPSARMTGRELPLAGWENASLILTIEDAALSDEFARVFEDCAQQLQAFLDRPNFSVHNSGFCAKANLKGRDLDARAAVSFDALLAMLVLGFPDLRWEHSDSSGQQIEITCLPPGSHALFDSQGWASQALSESGSIEHRREELCVVLEDEPDYGYFEAYAAYLAGLRVELLTGFRAMAGAKFDRNPDLTLEDWDLNPFDYTQRDSLKDKATRQGHLPWLALVGPRVTITAGDPDPAEVNEKVISKPFSGLHSLGEMITLNLPGLARPKPVGGPSPMSAAHAAPGRITLIAQLLLARVRGRDGSGSSVRELLRCAYLMDHAAALLNNRSSSVLFESLMQKHRLEVLAETRFPGVLYNLGVTARIEKIYQTLEQAVRSFPTKEQVRVGRDREISILVELAMVLRGGGQFEQEHECVNRVRVLQLETLRKSKQISVPWRDGGGFFGLPEKSVKQRRPLWILYTQIITGKPHPLQLFKWSALWMILGALILYAVELASQSVEPPASEHWGFMKCFGTVASAFLGGSVETSHGTLFIFITFFIVAFGLLHVGLLVAYLFSFFTRK